MPTTRAFASSSGLDPDGPERGTVRVSAICVPRMAFDCSEMSGAIRRKGGGGYTPAMSAEKISSSLAPVDRTVPTPRRGAGMLA
jgi:hypothetical protein